MNETYQTNNETKNSPIAGDQCPMYFDDGSYPWSNTENYIKIFNWDFVRSSAAIQLPLAPLLIGVVNSLLLLLFLSM